MHSWKHNRRNHQLEEPMMLLFAATDQELNSITSAFFRDARKRSRDTARPRARADTARPRARAPRAAAK